MMNGQIRLTCGGHNLILRHAHWFISFEDINDIFQPEDKDLVFQIVAIFSIKYSL